MGRATHLPVDLEQRIVAMLEYMCTLQPASPIYKENVMEHVNCLIRVTKYWDHFVDKDRKKMGVTERWYY